MGERVCGIGKIRAKARKGKGRINFRMILLMILLRSGARRVFITSNGVCSFPVKELLARSYSLYSLFLASVPKNIPYPASFFFISELKTLVPTPPSILLHRQL